MSANNNKLKIIVETKTLAHALFFACSVADKRNVLTEFSHIKLLATNDRLELMATDMDLYLSQAIAAQILLEGEIAVSIWTISDIVKKIPDQEITLMVSDENDQLEIIGKNCHFKVMTMQSSTFPQMDDMKSETKLTVPCDDLAKIIESTKFSLSTDETRYNLTGIYLHVRGGELCSASTDGHRLSVSSVALKEKTNDFGVILPKKAALEILKILRDYKNIKPEVEILFSYTKIKFILDENIVLLSKLIDGVFPEYEGFLPKNTICKLTINSKILADAINRVSIVTVDKFRAVKLLLSSKEVEIRASGEARGEAKEKILISQEPTTYCNFDGQEDLTIAFNPHYLIDVLDTIKYDMVELYFTDTSSPMLIKFPESPKDSFVVMPVKA